MEGDSMTDEEKRAYTRQLSTNAASNNRRLLRMELGERLYFDTTLEDFASDMRTLNTPKSRRPPDLEGREFSTSLFTAVGVGKAGNVRYLICLERIA